MQKDGAQGMMLINDALTKLVRDGIIEPQEAYDKAIDKEELLAKFSKLGYEITQSDTQHQLLPLTPKPVESKPVVVEHMAAVLEGEQSQIAPFLSICDAPFQCCPLQQVIIPEEPTVYVVLGVDEWGTWNVLDVGQTDQTGNELQVAERQSHWKTKCPSENLWFGLHAVRGSLSRNRKALESTIIAKHGLHRA